jgi:hypothetical protein
MINDKKESKFKMIEILIPKILISKILFILL